MQQVAKHSLGSGRSFLLLHFPLALRALRALVGSGPVCQLRKVCVPCFCIRASLQGPPPHLCLCVRAHILSLSVPHSGTLSAHVGVCGRGCTARLDLADTALWSRGTKTITCPVTTVLCINKNEKLTRLNASLPLNLDETVERERERDRRSAREAICTCRPSLSPFPAAPGMASTPKSKSYRGGGGGGFIDRKQGMKVGKHNALSGNTPCRNTTLGARALYSTLHLA